MVFDPKYGDTKSKFEVWTLHVIWIQSSVLIFSVLGRFLALPFWCGDPDKKSQASKICCYRLPIIVQSTSKVYSSHNGTDSMEGILFFLLFPPFSQVDFFMNWPSKLFWALICNNFIWNNECKQWSYLSFFLRYFLYVKSDIKEMYFASMVFCGL